ncbi:MAG: serine hydrolase [Alphaproteobacteria bacterium]|nr:serine hydrolase [Alphaproteobacteria bacterium]
MDYGRFTLIALLAASTPAWAEPRGGEAAVAALFQDIADPAGPGCAASVTQNGALAYEHVFGLANLEQPSAIRADTIFEAGSVSKQFTAAAIAVLVARGQMSLDDDIRRYLAEMPDYGAPISVRMLLTHTSGIRNWDDLVELAGRPREDASGFSQTDAFAIIARQRGLNFPAGSEYLYSNSNYVLAALIVERVSGKSFAAFSHDELFAPLGMSRTSWREDYTRVVPGRAEAYTPGDDGVLHIDMPGENVIGPGGLLTTIGDLQRWNAFLEHPTRAGRAWTRVLTTTRGALADGTAIAYGMGLESGDIAGNPVSSHAGATAGYRAYLARSEAQHVSVALLCNAGAINTEDVGPQFAALFLREQHERASQSESRPVIVAAVDVAGRYRNVGTGALVTVTQDEAGIHFNGGSAFASVAVDRFVNGAGTRNAVVRRSAQGAIVSVALTRVGNSTVELAPVAAWAPGADALAAFVGAYYSDDVQAVWTVAFDGEVLRARGPRGETFLLDPLYEDVFAGRDAYWTFVFERGADGAVTGIALTKTRTRGVRFERRR